MATRTRSQQIVFSRPFVLSGLNSVQPAGSYRVDIDEEQLDTLTAPAWRRTATVIQLWREGAMEHLTVDPAELLEALVRDGAQTGHDSMHSLSAKSWPGMPAAL